MKRKADCFENRNSSTSSIDVDMSSATDSNEAQRIDAAMSIATEDIDVQRVLETQFPTVTLEQFERVIQHYETVLNVLTPPVAVEIKRGCFIGAATAIGLDTTIARALFDALVERPPERQVTAMTGATGVSTTVMRAFDSEYFDPFQEVESLIAYIATCQGEYYDHHLYWYSPYFSLCQSSGWGKSRLLRELGRKMRVLYVSFMKTDSRGYPPRSSKAIEFLKGANWEKLEENLKMAVSRLHQIAIPLDFMEYGDRFWDAMSSLQHGQSEPFDRLKNKVESKKETKPLASDTVVIVIDEARELFDEYVGQEYYSRARPSLFVEFRRKFIQLARVSNRSDFPQVVGIFTDTSSRICNLSPPSGPISPSSRAVRDGLLLFRPFIPTSNMDVIEKRERGNDGCVHWTNETYVLKLGRPLWSSVEKPVKLAAQKLTLNKPEKEESALAVFLARVGIFLSATHHYTGELVANHMATLLATNADRTAFLVTYVSEPCLSMGAKALWKDETYFKEKMVPAVRRALMYGAVLEGFLGEVVACSVLLLAMDASSRNDDWVDLSTFVNQMTGGVVSPEDLCYDGKLKEPKICVTHFVPWYRELEKADVLMLVKRRAGCILQRDQDGVDLLLPFWQKDDSDTASMTASTCSDVEYEVGLMLVQVKNCIAHEDMREVGYKLHKEYVFGTSGMEDVPTINVVLELGLGRDEAGETTRIPEVVNVCISVDATGKGDKSGKVQSTITVETSSSSHGKEKTVAPEMTASEFRFLRLESLDAIKCFEGKDTIKAALKELLAGPIHPGRWWENHKHDGCKTNMPSHKLHLDKICIGLDSKETT